MAIQVQFNTGKSITLRPTHGKKGQTFLAARPASEEIVSRFGFNVPMSLVSSNDSLPTSAKIVNTDGNKVLGTVKLESGVTGTGHPKVSGDKAITVSVDGEDQQLKIERISRPRSGTANLLIRSARPNGGRTFDEL